MAKHSTAQSATDVVFEALPLRFAVVDSELRIVRSSASWCTYLECTGERCDGCSLAEATPALAQVIEVALKDAFATGEPKLGVVVDMKNAKSGNGTQAAPVRVDIVPIRFESAAASLVLIVADSGQYELESRMLSLKRQYQETIEAIPGLFWRIDMQGKLREWNSGVPALTGYSDDELRGMWAPHLVLPQEREMVREAIARGFRQGVSGTEMHFLTKSGAVIPCFGAGRHVVVGGEDFLVGLTLDITNLADARRLLQERLAFEAQLAEISSRFVSALTGDLDEAIDSALLWFMEVLDADRAFLAQFDEQGAKMLLTHASARMGLAMLPDEHFSDRFPWFVERLHESNPLLIPDIADLPPAAAADVQYASELELRAVLAIPLQTAATTLGALMFTKTEAVPMWPDDLVPRLELFTHILVNALLQRQKTREIENLKNRLEQENIYLRREVKLAHGHEDMVAQSAVMRRVLAEAEQVAGTDSTVLIEGETGTGKELLARSIHNLSSRRDRPLVIVNCASLPEALVESELFGREKGAYTGAMSRQAGRFEVAHQSTIMLDEIGELPLEVQAKLLRVLQDGSFERLGSVKTIHVDVRVIAATNRDLAGAVAAGKFRGDLFYRLSVFPIKLPPLRDRPQDIEALVWKFVHEFGERMGRRIDTIPKSTVESFVRYPWPGNIRELRNVIERAVIVSTGSVLRVDLPSDPPDVATANLDDMMREHIRNVLDACNWRIKGAGGAADRLGVNPSTLYSRMKRLGIERS